MSKKEALKVLTEFVKSGQLKFESVNKYENRFKPKPPTEEDLEILREILSKTGVDIDKLIEEDRKNINF